MSIEDMNASVEMMFKSPSPYLTMEFQGGEPSLEPTLIKYGIELAEEKGTVIEYNKPEADNYKYVNNGYVSMDYPEGKYDISFVYKNKLAYFMTISLTKESE